MEYVRLGKSNLMVSRTAIGSISLAKIDNENEAVSLVRDAYNKGINFFDASHNFEKSEKLLGDSLSNFRGTVMISSRTSSQSSAEIRSDLENTLNTINSDFLDLYQFESNDFIPEKEGSDGIYKTFESLKDCKKIRHIGFVTENLDIAEKAACSGFYETLQFPFSMVSSEKTHNLVKLCAQNDIGFIAMQPLCGGLLNNIPLALGFLQQYENVIPLWGVQSSEELQQILYFSENPPLIDGQFIKDVEMMRNFFN